MVEFFDIFFKKHLTEGVRGGILNGHSRKKGMQKRYTEKNKKKFKNAVDIRKIIWYINEATCGISK